jgi:hypothetical protein
MKAHKITVWLYIVLTLVLTASIAAAGDFEWTKDFNIKAEADRDGFKAQLSTRFNIGKAQVKVVLENVDSPSDAYMVLRLGEMSSKSIDQVLSQYRTRKNKGWGVVAKNLGIKPGSKKFHALKRGSDLYFKADKIKGKKISAKARKTV